MSQAQSLGDKQTEAKHRNALDLLGQLVRFPSTSYGFPYNPKVDVKGHDLSLLGFVVFLITRVI